jgi:hypothetical protein
MNPVDRRLTVLSMKERIAVRFSAMVRARESARTRGKPPIHELAYRACQACVDRAAMAVRVAWNSMMTAGSGHGTWLTSVARSGVAPFTVLRPAGFRIAPSFQSKT